MPTATSNITKLYAPQFEQFDLGLKDEGMVLTGQVSNSKGAGRAWIVPISDTCVVMDHYITPMHDMLLAEYTPEPYACVTEVSEACVDCMSSIGIAAKPVLSNQTLAVPQMPVLSTNTPSSVYTFLQDEVGCEKSPLFAGHVYHSRSIMFFDGYFKNLERAYPTEYAGMFEDFNRMWSPEASSAICSALHRLSFARMNQPGAQLYVRSLVEGMVAEMAYARSADTYALEYQGSRANHKLAEEARALIDRLVDEGAQASLEELAERLYVSRSKLCAVFKQETGEAIGAYVRRRRIERAQKLLANKRFSIADIAARLGYPSQSAFAQSFKQITGLTPTEWRAHIKK